MNKQVNRRIFLRGLGGAVVAAPFLNSVAERRVKADPAAAPRRLIAMFTHYGCITTRFFPTKSHGALTAADLQPTTLKHLAPFVGKLLIPRGIRGMNEWTANMSRGQGNDPHTQVVGSYFTCHPVTPNSDNPFSFEIATKFEAKPLGPSLDHVIAQQLSPNGTPLFMRVGNRTDNATSAISYSASTTGYAGVGTPAEAFSSLTGLFRDGPLSPDSYQAARGKSVLDLVKDDLATLQRFDMSRSDQLKLEAWKALLHETQGVISSQCTQATAAKLGATQKNVDAVMLDAPDILGQMVTATLDGADVYSNLAVLAAACNANPVIVLKYPPSYVFKSLGLSIESHTLSHRLANANMAGNCLTGALDMLLTIDDYYARKFAYLVGLLDSIDEGDRKLLDNSAAVWFQEMSDGNAHNLNNLPIIQAGSAGGYFKTGWAVNVDGGAANLSNGNSEAFCNPGGTSIDTVTSTGTDPQFANAPINKYFCNLMNALGVKAAENGFPTKGGTEEVIRYGMYDKTEDFIHGGTAPPKINSPGAFDALKANA